MPGMLARFRRPDDKAIADVRELLLELEPNPKRYRFSLLRAVWRASVKGDVDEVLARLRSVLDKDHAELEQKLTDKPVSHDYVVRPSTDRPGALEVMTRLRRLETGENIFYGRLIQRLSDDRFALWEDG